MQNGSKAKRPTPEELEQMMTEAMASDQPQKIVALALSNLAEIADALSRIAKVLEADAKSQGFIKEDAS